MDPKGLAQEGLQSGSLVFRRCPMAIKRVKEEVNSIPSSMDSICCFAEMDDDQVPAREELMLLVFRSC